MLRDWGTLSYGTHHMHAYSFILNSKTTQRRVLVLGGTIKQKQCICRIGLRLTWGSGYLVDFLERLVARINEIDGLPVPCVPGYLMAGESLGAYPIPGSTDERVYMDGTKDVRLMIEIAMRSNTTKTIHDTLWLIQK